MIGALLVAAQLAIVAHAPDSASACDAVEISVAVHAPGTVPPRLIVPSFAPFDVLRSSVVPRLTYDAQGGGVTAEYRYVLTTDHPGIWSIAPFEARLGSATARSRLIQIAVSDGRSGTPSVVARARIDTSLAVSFRAVTAPETVYVGQQTNYEVAVFLNETVRDRMRRNPTFFPPDMQAMLAYDLPARGDSQRREVASHCFEALVYQRALFPLLAGRISIPPAQLVYSLPLSASYFSREETHELETDSTVLVAVEPPIAGRPLDYGGAVGNLRVAARLDTNETRVGDPLVLTLRVSGTGNVKLFPRPTVGVVWATLVNGDERVKVDTTARRIAGSKEFDWVLTPRVAGELDVPPIHYSYFNPDSRRYETTATAPAHVFVHPGILASGDTARTETLLSLRPRYRGPLGTPLHEHPAFWALLALAPVPAITLRRRTRRLLEPRAITPAERLATLTRDEARSRDPREVRHAYTRLLADRLGLEAEVFTDAGALARALRRRGVSADVARDAERLLRQLDQAAFSANGVLPGDAVPQLARIAAAVDAEAIPRARLVTTALCVAALVAAGIGTAQAYDATIAERAFDAGVTAYLRHDFVAARERFIASVAAEPRAPDAWANLGTASWAASDTARSVAAWQRAVRLEPLATDVRERVELVHSLPWTSAGYVPPLPPAWLFELGALLWLGAWGRAAFLETRGVAMQRRLLTGLTAGAAALVVCGLALAERTSGRTAAVVRETASLSNDPELGAERGATAIVGEVVRVAGRQGAWSHVYLDDGRSGWLESSGLIPLDPREVSAERE